MTALLVLVILAACVYVGYQFGLPYYRYEAFKSDVKEIARLGLGDVEKVRKEVYEVAEDLKIPIEEKDIIVTQKAHAVRVVTEWSVDVDIQGMYHKQLVFKVDIEE